MRLSYIDLDDRSIHGGRSGASPMVNWYLSDNLRLEFAYVIASSIASG